MKDQTQIFAYLEPESAPWPFLKAKPSSVGLYTTGVVSVFLPCSITHGRAKLKPMFPSKLGSCRLLFTLYNKVTAQAGIKDGYHCLFVTRKAARFSIPYCINRRLQLAIDVGLWTLPLVLRYIERWR